MMHQHFYHWHNRVELKPDTTILNARWDAAATFAEGLDADTVCLLIRMALFGTTTQEFANQFSENLVSQEPTFPPEGNIELLRVMATAALYSQLEIRSEMADAVALGLFAAGFQRERIHPVCKELEQSAAEYLAAESELMRPAVRIESEYTALKSAVDDEEEDWSEKPEATQLLGKAVIELGKAMQRISEENQFLWWLLGRNSSMLSVRREKLGPKEYALVAAAEAAERVDLLPPPASVESLIGEVLSHCQNPSLSPLPLGTIVDSADIACTKALSTVARAQEICPIGGLLQIRKLGGRVDSAAFEKLKISKKLKVSPTEAANQYFRELMFLRALENLG
jgi:hypothetical protein